LIEQLLPNFTVYTYRKNQNLEIGKVLEIGKLEFGNIGINF